MELKRILYPTDFSKNAGEALPYVNSLAQKYQTEVHVLFVVEDMAHHESWYGEFDKTHIEKIMDWENKTAKKRLDELCEKYLDGCPLYIKHIAVGDPAKEILDLAEKEGLDMIVMATRGKKGNFAMGSVTDKVVKNAGIPVVAIPVGS